MEIIILGSGGYIPTKEKNSPGYLVKTEGKNLVFDFGTGVLKSLLNFDVNFQSIDYIFLTHNHSDHIADLIPFFHVCKSNRKRGLTIVGFVGVEKFIKDIFKIIPNTSPKSYHIDYIEMANNNISIKNIKIKSKILDHYNKNCIGFRVEIENKVIVYTGDTDMCDNLIVLSKNADLLISECSQPNELKCKGHLIPVEIGEVATKANAKKLVLTHLSPDWEKYNIKSQIKESFDGEVVIAEDLMKINL